MSSLKENFKEYIIGIAALLIAAYSFLFISFSYFSVLDNCFIKIKNPGLLSSKKSIKEAIALLKKSDKGAYKTFCSYTNRIVEKYCEGSDWHIDKNIRGQNEPGCYIKGSKTIYLDPRKKTLSAKEISESLKKYSLLSKEFWD